MWFSALIAAAEDPSTFLPIVGAGGAGLSAVLLYLLLDEKKERRSLQQLHDESLMKMLPVLTAITMMQDRVFDALSKQVEYHDRRPSDPEILRKAYDQLEYLLDQYPPPTTTRKRGRGTSGSNE